MSLSVTGGDPGREIDKTKWKSPRVTIRPVPTGSRETLRYTNVMSRLHQGRDSPLLHQGSLSRSEGDAGSVAYHNEARPKKWGRLIAEFDEQVELSLPQGIRFLLTHGEMAIEMIHQYWGVDIASDPEAGNWRLTIVDCRLLIEARP
jgi:hypothetical protein